MSTFSLLEFQAEVLGNTGLARQNRFEVIIIPPPSIALLGRKVSLFTEQTNLPLQTIIAKPFRIHNNPIEQRPLAVEYGGEGINFTFHLDSDMNVKRFFDQWCNLIVGKDDYLVNYSSEYLTDILIRQLNEQDMVTYEIKLIEAYPRNINMLPLDNNAVAQTHRLNVLFAYKKWIPTFDYDLKDVPLLIQQPQVPRIDNRI